MGQHILHGNPPLPIDLRVSSRARRITLRVSALDGAVTLTLPRGVPEHEAIRFAQEKETWVRAQLSEQEPVVQVAMGQRIPIEGRARQIAPGEGRKIVLGDATVKVPGPEDRVSSRLLGFLKTLARTRLAVASDRYAAKLGRPYERLSIRDTRSRWGSCSASGALSYSWRLILAPPQVLEYVAAHEVAHLAEMNHSPAFWAVVETLYGPYDAERNWLRNEGTKLHRYRFT